MKQITNKEYEEWQKYKEEKAKGHVLMPDTLRFICAANDYDPTKIGQHSWRCCPRYVRRKKSISFTCKPKQLKMASCFQSLWCQDAIL